ncbi:MAG: hypothetical protein J6Q54_02815 [Oscillospiraceae bacterium]|nr:hypothetical protein [Oscillospiraceae bacterium]
MKRVILTTLIILIVPCLMFLPIYGYLIYTANVNAKDYRQEIQGDWETIQYYYEGQRVACNEESWMHLTFGEDTLSVRGTVLPETDTACTWESGCAVSYEQDGEKVSFLLSNDAHNNLKIIVDGTSYIILLRRSGG